MLQLPSSLKSGSESWQVDRVIFEELMRCKLRGRLEQSCSRLGDFSSRLATWELLMIIYSHQDREIRSIGQLIGEVTSRSLTERSLYKFIDDQLVRKSISVERIGTGRRKISLSEDLMHELRRYALRAGSLL